MSKINYSNINEKRATRLKKTMLASALSFGIVLGSMQNVFCVKEIISSRKKGQLFMTTTKDKKPYVRIKEHLDGIPDDEKKTLIRGQLNSAIIAQGTNRKKQLDTLRQFLHRHKEEYKDIFPCIFSEKKDNQTSVRIKGQLFMTTKKPSVRIKEHLDGIPDDEKKTLTRGQLKSAIIAQGTNRKKQLDTLRQFLHRHKTKYQYTFPYIFSKKKDNQTSVRIKEHLDSIPVDQQKALTREALEGAILSGDSAKRQTELNSLRQFLNRHPKYKDTFPYIYEKNKPKRYLKSQTNKENVTRKRKEKTRKKIKKTSIQSIGLYDNFKPDIESIGSDNSSQELKEPAKDSIDPKELEEDDDRHLYQPFLI